PMRRPVCSSIIREVPAALLEGAGGFRMGHKAKWMLKIEKANILDCDVIVQVYDTFLSPKDAKSVLTMSCASPDPGVIYINSSTLTVRLKHNNATDYTFSIIATARKVSSKPDVACQGFKCESGPCVAKSLICDAVDNCFDYSDESINGTAYCEAGFWPFQGENWGVLASVLGAAVVLGITAACCRHIRGKRRSSIDELYERNEGPYVHKYAYRYAIIRPPKKPNQTNVVLGRDGHMHYNATTV
ncbi:unnamed protein product, partial [Candidula unifasciata]